jgi:hypothetical protein
MSTITVLRSNFDSTHWKRAFADCLMSLRPDMNPDAADEISDKEYLQAKDFDPSAAARRWVLQQSALDVSLPAANAG